MMLVLLAIGLVLVVEGLVYALAPSLVEQALRLLASLPVERRRLFGLTMVALGAALISLVRAAGGI